MPEIKTVVTDYDLITAYGRGIQPLWEGVLSAKSSIRELKRFPTSAFNCHIASYIDSLNTAKPDSLVMQMLKPVLKENLRSIPRDAFLILATTVGEIDLAEKAVLKRKKPQGGKPPDFLKKVKSLLGLRNGMLISCACASSSTAIAQAARLINSGREDCCLVVAADAVSEFTFSGFSALMALDRSPAAPFDKDRAGLSLGEAAGFILLMSRERSKKEKRESLAEIAGWGLSCDANHMTGPSRKAEGLIRAISAAMEKAGIPLQDIGCISSHGTGTLYNDAMELLAYKEIFKKPVDIYSIKGCTGHTLGAAGLVETILALKVRQEDIIPGTTGLKEPDPQASGWASSLPKKLGKPAVLLNNCGFGGINAALILS